MLCGIVLATYRITFACMGSAGQIILIFQFKTDFTDTNRPLNLALNPHLLYTLLPVVYFFCKYFKNNYKFACLYKY